MACRGNLCAGREGVYQPAHVGAHDLPGVIFSYVFRAVGAHLFVDAAVRPQIIQLCGKLAAAAEMVFKLLISVRTKKTGYAFAAAKNITGFL